MTIPFYKQKKDALGEIGITARQESHWRQSGLYEPEIGQARFTERDIRFLDFLRRLIVPVDRHGRFGLGLSVETVRRLLDSRPQWERYNADGTVSRTTNPVPLPMIANSKNRYHTRFIDVFTGKLASWTDVFRHMVSIHLAQSRNVEDWIATLTFIRFKELRRQYMSDPTLYQAHRDRLLSQIHQMDLAARAFTDEEDSSFGFSPALPGDPPLREYEHEDRERVRNLE